MKLTKAELAEVLKAKPADALEVCSLAAHLCGVELTIKQAAKLLKTPVDIASESNLIRLLDHAQQALDVLAGDVEDILPARADGATELAMTIRSAIQAARKRR